MTNPFSLTGKTALVTGAGTGIGKRCVEQMAKMGARVLATDINEGAIAEVGKMCRDQGLLVQTRRQDVASEADWRETSNDILSTFGDWNVLVNNAGIYQGDLLVQNTLEDVRRMLQVNVEAIFLGMKSAAIAMQPGGQAGNGGSIVNLSSVAGLVGVPSDSAYGASKGAVRMYSRHAAIEFATLNYGIRVNSLHPGLIATDMGDQVFNDFVRSGLAPDVQAARELVMSMTPSKRFGTVDDVVNALIYLASDASSYVTGAELVVDGGLTAA